MVTAVLKSVGAKLVDSAAIILDLREESKVYDSELRNIEIGRFVLCKIKFAASWLFFSLPGQNRRSSVMLIRHGMGCRCYGVDMTLNMIYISNYLTGKPPSLEGPNLGPKYPITELLMPNDSTIAKRCLQGLNTRKPHIFRRRPAVRVDDLH